MFSCRPADWEIVLERSTWTHLFLTWKQEILQRTIENSRKTHGSNNTLEKTHTPWNIVFHTILLEPRLNSLAKYNEFAKSTQVHSKKQFFSYGFHKDTERGQLGPWPRALGPWAPKYWRCLQINCTVECCMVDCCMVALLRMPHSRSLINEALLRRLY